MPTWVTHIPDNTVLALLAVLAIVIALLWHVINDFISCFYYQLTKAVSLDLKVHFNFRVCKLKKSLTCLLNLVVFMAGKLKKKTISLQVS